ncbi:hypothetical protein QQS21_007710 [Conoideocrella luteorostrata]|uniref:Uncharacterized protein n=1 Tax=Conoideocrella luteorostrata TaxID=1105319 RepID=A0AAJ0CKK9_9HYPO|nr:hypothetical protein QQS21_007710 [Conoideocrella luteorostrata]
MSASTRQSSATAAPSDHARPPSNESREPMTISHEVEQPPQRPWTPEPEIYIPDEYAAWGRKHFGEEWYRLQKIALEERNNYLEFDQIYRERRDELRSMENKKQKGKLRLKGKTWQELMEWARLHYGQEWFQHWEAISTTDEEPQSASFRERLKAMSNIQCDIDGRMLAEGKTWHEIMAFPAEPPNVTTAPAIDGDGCISPSPCIKGDEDVGELSTCPPVPTTFRDQAWSGPLRYGEWKQDEFRWDIIEWCGVNEPCFLDGRSPEEQYESSKVSLTEYIRSWHQDGYRRAREAIEVFRDKDKERFRIEKKRFKAHVENSRRGWTQEQINAAYDTNVAMHEFSKANPPPRRVPVTEEEKRAEYARHQKYYDALVRYYGEIKPDVLSSPSRIYRIYPSNHYPRLNDLNTAGDLWRKGIHGRLSRRQQREALSDPTVYVPSHAQALERIEDEQEREREVIQTVVQWELEELARLQQRATAPTQVDMGGAFQNLNSPGMPIVRDFAYPIEWAHVRIDNKRCAGSGEGQQQLPAIASRTAQDASHKTLSDRDTTKNYNSKSTDTMIPDIRWWHQDDYRRAAAAATNLSPGEEPPNFSLAIGRMTACNNLPKKGWTLEQIQTAYDADAAMYKWYKANPCPEHPPTTDQEKTAEAVRSQEHNEAFVRFYGELLPEKLRDRSPFYHEENNAINMWRKYILARLSRRQLREILSNRIRISLSDKKLWGIVEDHEQRERQDVERLIEPEPAHDEQVPAEFTKSKTPPRAPNSSIQAKVLPQNRRRRSSETDGPEGLGENRLTAPQTRRKRQRRVFTKERTSRRLAKMEPEYEMLESNTRLSSNSRRVNPSGRQSDRPSKMPKVVWSEKPRGIVKTVRAGTRHSERSR